jgi:hypothetical protein
MTSRKKQKRKSSWISRVGNAGFAGVKNLSRVI